MKKHFTNSLAILLALLPLAYLAFIYHSLPQTVPVHFDAEMKPDRMGDKGELWWASGIIAAVSISTYFLLKNIHRIYPKRKNTVPSATFHKLAFGLVVFIGAINFMIIKMSQGSTVLQNLLFPLLGIMVAFIGNYMVHIKPNYFAGFRLPWTLSNDENWRKTHQLGGKLWFAGGLVIAIVSLFLSTQTALILFVAVIAIMVVIPLVYSYRLFKKQSSF
ncbi:MAG TPA: SdpI family protein [Flavisolibacter sp.]